MRHGERFVDLPASVRRGGAVIIGRSVPCGPGTRQKRRLSLRASKGEYDHRAQ
jgi:hypothetical protein